MDKASELIAAKTLTISKLLAIAPPGTIDPTPHLYDTTMYTLSAMMMVAFLSHSFVRPLQQSVTAKSTVIDVKESTVIIDPKKGKAEEIIGDRQVNK